MSAPQKKSPRAEQATGVIANTGNPIIMHPAAQRHFPGEVRS